MIEELKSILTMVEKVPETVLWVLGGFALYKLVIYLSTTGAIVMLVRLAIEKWHDARTRPEPAPEPTYLKLDDMLLYETLGPELRMHIKSIVPPGGGNYIQSSHLNWLAEAIREKKERERVAKQEKKL